MSTDVCICHIGASTIVWLPHKSFQRTDQNMEESMVQCVYMHVCVFQCMPNPDTCTMLCIFAFGSAWPLIHVYTDHVHVHMYMYSCVSLAEVHVHVYYIYIYTLYTIHTMYMYMYIRIHHLHVDVHVYMYVCEGW